MDFNLSKFFHQTAYRPYLLKFFTTEVFYYTVNNVLHTGHYHLLYIRHKELTYGTAQLQGKTRVARSRVLLASSLLTRRQLLSVLYYISYKVIICS